METICINQTLGINGRQVCWRTPIFTTLNTGHWKRPEGKFKTVLGHGPHTERLLSYSKLENKSLF